MVKKALVCLVDKAEDTEVVIPVDVMRRAGIEVIIAGVQGPDPVTCVEYVRIVPDVEIDLCVNDLFDVIVLPGGPGYEYLQNNQIVHDIVKKHVEKNKMIAAICAGVKVLNYFKIGYGSKIAVHPIYKQDLSDNYNVTNERVCIDGNLVTSQSPGTAFDFALTIVKSLVGKEKSKEIAEMLRAKF